MTDRNCIPDLEAYASANPERVQVDPCRGCGCGLRSVGIMSLDGAMYLADQGGPYCLECAKRMAPATE